MAAETQEERARRLRLQAQAELELEQEAAAASDPGAPPGFETRSQPGGNTSVAVNTDEPSGYDLDALYQASQGPGMNQAKAYGIGEPTPLQDLSNFDITPKTPMFPENKTAGLDPLGIKYGVDAVKASLSDVARRVEAGVYHISAPLVGAVHGTGMFDYQMKRGDMAASGDPDLANFPSPDTLLESVPFSGMPGMDPAILMEHLPSVINAFRTGKRVADAEKDLLLFTKVAIPEGTGTITRVAKDGDIVVNIGGTEVRSSIMKAEFTDPSPRKAVARHPVSSHVVNTPSPEDIRASMVTERSRVQTPADAPSKDFLGDRVLAFGNPGTIGAVHPDGRRVRIDFITTEPGVSKPSVWLDPVEDSKNGRLVLSGIKDAPATTAAPPGLIDPVFQDVGPVSRDTVVTARLPRPVPERVSTEKIITGSDPPRPFTGGMIDHKQNWDTLSDPTAGTPDAPRASVEPPGLPVQGFEERGNVRRGLPALRNKETGRFVYGPEKEYHKNIALNHGIERDMTTGEYVGWERGLIVDGEFLNYQDLQKRFPMDGAPPGLDDTLDMAAEYGREFPGTPIEVRAPFVDMERGLAEKIVTAPYNAGEALNDIVAREARKFAPELKADYDELVQPILDAIPESVRKYIIDNPTVAQEEVRSIIKSAKDGQAMAEVVRVGLAKAENRVLDSKGGLKLIKKIADKYGMSEMDILVTFDPVGGDKELLKRMGKDFEDVQTLINRRKNLEDIAGGADELDRILKLPNSPINLDNEIGMGGLPDDILAKDGVPGELEFSDTVSRNTSGGRSAANNRFRSGALTAASPRDDVASFVIKTKYHEDLTRSVGGLLDELVDRKLIKMDNLVEAKNLPGQPYVPWGKLEGRSMPMEVRDELRGFLESIDPTVDAVEAIVGEAKQSLVSNLPLALANVTTNMAYSLAGGASLLNPMKWRAWILSTNDIVRFRNSGKISLRMMAAMRNGADLRGITTDMVDTLKVVTQHLEDPQLPTSEKWRAIAQIFAGSPEVTIPGFGKTANKLVSVGTGAAHGATYGGLLGGLPGAAAGGLAGGLEAAAGGPLRKAGRIGFSVGDPMHQLATFYSYLDELSPAIRDASYPISKAAAREAWEKSALVTQSFDPASFPLWLQNLTGRAPGNKPGWRALTRVASPTFVGYPVNWVRLGKHMATNKPVTAAAVYFTPYLVADLLRAKAVSSGLMSQESADQLKEKSPLTLVVGTDKKEKKFAMVDMSRYLPMQNPVVDQGINGTIIPRPGMPLTTLITAGGAALSDDSTIPPWLLPEKFAGIKARKPAEENSRVAAILRIMNETFGGPYSALGRTKQRVEAAVQGRPGSGAKFFTGEKVTLQDALMSIFVGSAIQTGWAKDSFRDSQDMDADQEREDADKRLDRVLGNPSTTENEKRKAQEIYNKRWNPGAPPGFPR